MKTIQLKHPFSVNNIEFKELTVRRLKIRDLRALPKGIDEIEMGFRMLVTACEQPEEVIGELDMEDYTILSNELASAFQTAPKTT